MATWSQLHQYVTPYVPNAPSITIDQALCNAAISFCSFSGIHIETLDPVPVLPSVSRYPVESTVTDTTVEQVKGVWHNGRQLQYVSMDELAQRPTFWQDETGTPRAYTQDNQDEIILWPTPEAAGVLKIIAVLKPVPSAKGVTDWIFNKWYLDIANGAKAQLLLMPGLVWSNPQLGEYNQQLFEKAKAHARLEANRNFTRMSPRVNLKAIT